MLVDPADVTGLSVGGFAIPGFVLDLDATIVICHSEKEQAAPTWKKTFGYHPLLCFLDNTREALSGLLRAGSAGSNTAADHITVLDHALAQIPDAHRHGTDILIRSDSAGATHAFLRHIRGLRDHGVRRPSPSASRSPNPSATRSPRAWTGSPALDADGELRDGAEIAELTDLVDLSGYPHGTRFIVRRERPHPGAQLSLFDTIEGMRHQVFATDTPHGHGSLQLLEPRHRAHARVEDRIRSGKDTGFGRFPSRLFAINAAWLELALTGIDLLAWTRTLLLDGDTRPGRAEEAALPAPARRRPHHPHRPPHPPPHRRDLALGHRPRHRVRPPRRAATTDRLTPAPAPSTRDTAAQPDNRAGAPACLRHNPPRPAES